MSFLNDYFERIFQKSTETTVKNTYSIRYFFIAAWLINNYNIVIYLLFSNSGKAEEILHVINWLIKNNGDNRLLIYPFFESVFLVVLAPHVDEFLNINKAYSLKRTRPTYNELRGGTEHTDEEYKVLLESSKINSDKIKNLETQIVRNQNSEKEFNDLTLNYEIINSENERLRNENQRLMEDKRYSNHFKNIRYYYNVKQMFEKYMYKEDLRFKDKLKKLIIGRDQDSNDRESTVIIYNQFRNELDTKRLYYISINGNNIFFYYLIYISFFLNDYLKIEVVYSANFDMIEIEVIKQSEKKLPEYESLINMINSID